MCDVCGCDSHHHHHPHRHHDYHDHRAPVSVETRIMAKNDHLAAHNRDWLRARRIFTLNLMGAPGAGKTALLERTLRDGNALFVVEGDQATANDGERIRAAGGRATQVNTGAGCHLDAHMVAHALEELAPPPGARVVIENVGNLVCPALFDLGEQRRAVVFSVTEGEDKPLKYPHMFRAAHLVLLAKVDLLPHLDFDADRAEANARALNPEVEVLRVSARSGEGLAQWYAWLGREAYSLSAASGASSVQRTPAGSNWSSA